MFGGSPVLLEGDVKDRQFANNVTGVVVQLGRNSENGKHPQRRERSIPAARFGKGVDAVNLDDWWTLGQISRDDDLWFRHQQREPGGGRKYARERTSTP